MGEVATIAKRTAPSFLVRPDTTLALMPACPIAKSKLPSASPTSRETVSRAKGDTTTVPPFWIEGITVVVMPWRGQP